MWYQIGAYFRFLWHSTNQHGVHSPFVYQLVTKCFYHKKQRPAYSVWEKTQQALKNDQREIQMFDAGAGSRVFSSEKRSISHIAKNAGTKSKRAKLLNRLVGYLEVGNAIELGTSLGLGSLAMILDNHLQLITVEACPETLTIANEVFQKNKCTSICAIHMTFDDFFAQHPPNITYDLVFLDGHHNGEATMRYYEKTLPFTHENTVLILGDIHSSSDMNNAWKILCKREEVSVSIDTFYWGFLFFRKGQVKEHFVVRV